MPSVSCPNQAFILAIAAWSTETDMAKSPGSHSLTFRSNPKTHLTAELRNHLEPILDQLRRSSKVNIPPVEALQRLKRAHRAEVRPDFDRIHPTWWLRALREEPPSVRAIIARHGPPQVRAALSPESDPLPNEARKHQAIPEEILNWVLALWAERLVGDLPEREDDPFAIAALTRFDDRSIFRLFRLTGLVKLALAGSRGKELRHVRLRSVDLDRIDGFLRFFVPLAPGMQATARRDIQAVVDRLEGRTTSNQRLALVGLSTFGRQLSCCEPYRVRWALQHLPYPIAKRIRNQMPRKPLSGHAIMKVESLVLSAAWHRLNQEGRRRGAIGRAPS